LATGRLRQGPCPRERGLAKLEAVDGVEGELRGWAARVEPGVMSPLAVRFACELIHHNVRRLLAWAS
jgi:hypothetical protein